MVDEVETTLLNSLTKHLEKDGKAPDEVWHTFHLVFGNRGTVATRLVDSRGIFCYTNKSNSRIVYEVKADQVAAIGRWFVLSNGFCSCSIVNRTLRPQAESSASSGQETSESSSSTPSTETPQETSSRYCSHRIAVALSKALNLSQERVVEDERLASMMASMHKTFI